MYQLANDISSRIQSPNEAAAAKDQINNLSQGALRSQGVAIRITQIFISHVCHACSYFPLLLIRVVSWANRARTLHSLGIQEHLRHVYIGWLAQSFTATKSAVNVEPSRFQSLAPTIS
jgi:hypothetical protein